MPQTFKTMDIPAVERNGSDKSIGYAADSVAPHAATQRANYTVPAGKAAIVEAACIQFMRDAAASVAAGRAGARVDIDGNPAIVKIRQVSNTVGVNQSASVSLQKRLKAGQGVRVVTEDASNDGSHDYSCTIAIWEFDA